MTAVRGEPGGDKNLCILYLLFELTLNDCLEILETSRLSADCLLVTQSRESTRECEMCKISSSDPTKNCTRKTKEHFKTFGITEQRWYSKLSSCNFYEIVVK
jgi:hypothetical protein